MHAISLICLFIIFSPLIASSFISIFSRVLQNKHVHSVAIAGVGISFLLSAYLVKQSLFHGMATQQFNWYEWGHIGYLRIQMGCMVDALTMVMAFVVTCVSLLVHIYSIEYMKNDDSYKRFFCYISLFTSSMLMLVLSNNFLQLFFGWEAVGLLSYLLIGFWFKKRSATQASLKAFLLNRVGDCGFLVSMIAIGFYFHSLQYQEVFSALSLLTEKNLDYQLLGISVSVPTFITMGLLFAALAKSAQLPLHFWLPDSMEGPTPISALIHAATMVTAGIFMIARLSPLFEYTELTLNAMLIIGSVTALLMGLVAIVQDDIKRIIAYSTISQLGYMMCGLGASAYALSIFHLVTHAFFKALLFLSVGSVILSMHHEQNIWKMRGLKRYLPWTHMMIWIGGLALIGFPGFSGFYSKDLLIEAVGLSTLPAAKMAYYLLLGNILITAFYIFRLIFVVFYGKTVTVQLVKEPGKLVFAALISLAVPTVLFGVFFTKPVLQGIFSESIMVHPQHASWMTLGKTFENLQVATLRGLLHWPFFFSMFGVLAAWLCYIKSPRLPQYFMQHYPILYRMLVNKFGFDILYQQILVRQTKCLAHFCWQIIDEKLIDYCMIHGIVRVLSKIASMIRRLQTGYIHDYSFMMILGFLMLLVWLMSY